MLLVDNDCLMYSESPHIKPQHLLPPRSSINFQCNPLYGHLVVIISPTFKAPQPAQPSDSLPWASKSECGLTHLIIFHLYCIQIQSISANPMLLWLWKRAVGKLQLTANSHANTHMVYITYMSTTPPVPHTVLATFTPPHTLNTYTRGSTLGHQILLILSQGSQQRRTEWWIKAGIRGEWKTDAQKQALQDDVCSERKLPRALLGKNHAKSDQSGLFIRW